MSFTGVVTFKNAHSVREAAQAVPLHQLLIETDCPYMAPVPLRGKRCEPSFLAHTAHALAKLRDEPAEHLVQATATNTRRVFGLPVP